MKFIQHLLSKGLIIAIAILAALGYHFRADLFPQWFKAPVSEEQSAQQSSPVDAAPDISPVASPVVSPDTSSDVPPAPPSFAVVPAPVQETPAAPLETPPASMSESMPEQAEQMPPPRYAPVEESAPASVAPQENTSPSSSDSADDATPPAETTASLDAARAAFWAQDFEQAEKLYQQLASSEPAAADALGELGNLYYTQGRWNDAAEAYAGTVTRLAAVGDIPRARHLLRVLDGLDPERAKAVWESISAGGS